MSREPDQTSDIGQLLSVRAWVELRDSTPDPAACDTSDAALVAAAVLADVRAVRDSHGEVILDTPAGSAGRRLANELNSVERLALAAQRLGVESLTARLRYDQDLMATSCADMFWHLSEAAELLNGLEDLRASALAEADGDRLSVVDVEPDDQLDVIDLGSPRGGGATIDLRSDSVAGIAPTPPPPDAGRGRIVAAAMGVKTEPVIAIDVDAEPGSSTDVVADRESGIDVDDPDTAVDPSHRTEGAGSDESAGSAESPGSTALAVTDSPVEELSLVPVEAEPVSTWEPPQPAFVPVPATRGRVAGSWRARRHEFRRERELIVDDERKRGRGLRPLFPTWLSQGAATLIVVFLIALVAVGIWMMVVSDVGPF